MSKALAKVHLLRWLPDLKSIDKIFGTKSREISGSRTVYLWDFEELRDFCTFEIGRYNIDSIFYLPISEVRRSTCTSESRGTTRGTSFKA